MPKKVPRNLLSYPRVLRRKDGKYYIDFTLKSKRYRLFNGKRINLNLNPNNYPESQKRQQSEILANKVYHYLTENNYSFRPKTTVIEKFDLLTKKKLSEPLSLAYKDYLKRIIKKLRTQLVFSGELSQDYLDSIVLRHENNTSFNTTRRHLNVIINYLYEHNFPIKKSKLKSRKQTEILHKPIVNIKDLFARVKSYDYDLFICCLLTYGCLLRPHQEIRLLKWEDFSSDLSYICLSGNRVKSRRNRIVPVPNYIKCELKKCGAPQLNIFSNRQLPYNLSYFSLKWRRFKKLNKDLNNNLTLYSFRHSGAINIYKRTGSLSKLQTAMGHSSLNVSLTYLRGLEVAELKEEDMPMI